MKAGVYITPQDAFVYVRKDRSIAAILHANSQADQPANVFAKTSEKEQRIEAPGAFDGKAQRIADVPNGCTDPLSHLWAVREKLVPAAAETQLKNWPVSGVSSGRWSHGDLQQAMANPPSWEAAAVEFAKAVYDKDAERGRAMPAPDFAQMVDAASGFAYVFSGRAAPDFAQVVNVAREEHRVYAKLAELQEQGVVELAQDEVVVLDQKRFDEAMDGGPRAPYLHYGFGGRVTKISDNPRAYWMEGQPLHAQMKKVGLLGWTPTEYEAKMVRLIELGAAWMCNKQSARKHRKQGHKVYRLGNGAFVWWRP